MNVKLKFWHPISLIATFFGLGKIPVAPGTFGTLGGLLLAYLNFKIMNSFFHNYDPAVKFLGSDMPLIIIFVFEFVIGTICAHIYAKNHTKDDPKEVVIDEVMGYLLVINIISPKLILIALHYHSEIEVLLTKCAILITISFGVFRLFDILKPWPISWCDKNIKGGFGIMFDDILAGLLAGFLSYHIANFI